MPNLVEIGPIIAEILQSFDYSRWPPLPSLILKLVKFYLLTVPGVPSFINVPNFIKITCFIAEILQFFIAAILDF